MKKLTALLVAVAVIAASPGPLCWAAVVQTFEAVDAAAPASFAGAAASAVAGKPTLLFPAALLGLQAVAVDPSRPFEERRAAVASLAAHGAAEVRPILEAVGRSNPQGDAPDYEIKRLALRVLRKAGFPADLPPVSESHARELLNKLAFEKPDVAAIAYDGALEAPLQPVGPDAAALLGRVEAAGVRTLILSEPGRAVPLADSLATLSRASKDKAAFADSTRGPVFVYGLDGKAAPAPLPSWRTDVLRAFRARSRPLARWLAFVHAGWPSVLTKAASAAVRLAPGLALASAVVIGRGAVAGVDRGVVVFSVDGKADPLAENVFVWPTRGRAGAHELLEALSTPKTAAAPALPRAPRPSMSNDVLTLNYMMGETALGALYAVGAFAGFWGFAAAGVVFGALAGVVALPYALILWKRANLRRQAQTQDDAFPAQYARYVAGHFDALFHDGLDDPKRLIESFDDFLSQAPGLKLNAGQLRPLAELLAAKAAAALPDPASPKALSFFWRYQRTLAKTLDDQNALAPLIAQSLAKSFKPQWLAAVRAALLESFLKGRLPQQERDFLRTYLAANAADGGEIVAALKSVYPAVDANSLLGLVESLRARRPALKVGEPDALLAFAEEVLAGSGDRRLDFGVLWLAASLLTGTRDADLDRLSIAFYRKHGLKGLPLLLRLSAGRSDQSFLALAAEGFLTPLPPARIVSRLSRAASRLLTPDRLAQYENATVRVLRDKLARFSDVLAAYEKKLPFYSKRMGEQLAQTLSTARGTPDETMLKDVLKRQNQVEDGLNGLASQYAQLNAPPSPWSDARRPWAALVESLPIAERAPFVAKLLERGASNRDSLVAVIARLEPTPEAARAVADFLHYPSRYSQDYFDDRSLEAMFSGDRLARFFPWLPAAASAAPIRDRFAVATRTGPSAAYDADWLSRRTRDRGLTSVLGFQPAVSYPNLGAEISSGFSSANPRSEIRGLIVQGAYDKAGHSLFGRLDAGRGQAQVEDDAAVFNAQLESSLRGGALSREPGLVRRLFVYQWALNSGLSQIQNMRNRAVWIAEQDSRFWDMRVEIHNFPSFDLLRRVKNFRARRGAGAVGSQLDSLIEELESFLSVQKPGTARLDAVIDSLPASDGIRRELRAAARAGRSPLESLEAVRVKYREQKAQRPADFAAIEVYTGDRRLSQTATAMAGALVERMPAVLNEAQLADLAETGRLILRQAVLDDYLSPQVEQALSVEARRVAGETDLPVARRAELLLRLFANAVEQARQGLTAEFGPADELMYHLVPRPSSAPIRAVDAWMRGSSIGMLARLVDHVRVKTLQTKDLSHTIGDRTFSSPIEVYNPGRAVGVLRIDKPPMELKSGEIGFFTRVPDETGALSGIVTLGSGALLSHLQLLARSMHIPNIAVSESYLPLLRAYEGQRVELVAHKDGHVEIDLADAAPSAKGPRREPPSFAAGAGDSKPVTLAELGARGYPPIVGSKTMQLARLFNDPELKGSVPDSFSVPIGAFQNYARTTGIWPWIEALRRVRRGNARLLALISSKIAAEIESKPVPPELLAPVLEELAALRERTGSKGYFFRSDDQGEDLAQFNAAGINKTEPNVPLDAAAVDKALRSVWASSFSEKSIQWKTKAWATDTAGVSLPGVLVMPTVSAESSGVIISRGGASWEKGRGLISADRGIGSVVESRDAVEEITLEGRAPLRFGLSVSSSKPVASASGGLASVAASPGTPILSGEQILHLNEAAQTIDKLLGDAPHGWDIEWAFDAAGRLFILQARPNP
jgi:hypothetical protein